MTTAIKMDARTLKGFMTPLLKSAGTDDMVPVLTGIHLRGISGTLVGTSTDRYRVSVHRYRPVAPDTYDGDDFDLLIPAGAIKRLLVVFGPTRRYNPPLVITVDSHSLTVSDLGGQSMTVRKMEGEYPKVASLVAAAAKYDPDDVAPSFSVNPHFLADIAAGAPGRNCGVTFRPPTKNNRLMVFQVTDDLLVLLMPRRVFDEPRAASIDLSSWTDLLGAS